MGTTELPASELTGSWIRRAGGGRPIATAPHREVARAKALLLAAKGVASTAITARLEVSPSSVVAWRERFGEEGVAKLRQVRPGRGRKPGITLEKIDEIVRLTLEADYNSMTDL